MAYTPRLVDSLLDRYVSGLPAVLVVGPRACGKTTSARRLTADSLRLDRPADAAVVRADPDLAIRSRRAPLLIDEWQVVPEVLGAVKRAVDDEGGAGRFVITGSSQADLAAEGWPATGRIIRLPMWGLCRRELDGDVGAVSIVDRLVSDGPDALRRQTTATHDLSGYVSMAMQGGFPDAALQPDPGLRRVWLSSYVDEIVTRDGALLDGTRDPVRLRRYLRAWAANTAGVPEHKTLYEAAEVNRMTAVGYDKLLQTLLVVEPLPAWSSNQLARLTSAPKRLLVDPALIGPLLGVDEQGVLRDPAVMGRLIETFVVAQLRPEIAVSGLGPRLFHLRQRDGRHEVDLIVELADGTVIGIEVKAASTVNPADARHLAWLRDELGPRFRCGLVVHAGPHTYPLGDRLTAAPICALWT